MLLIIFVGIIAKITLGFGGNEENCFDWNKVGTSVTARFLKQAAFIFVDWDYISYEVPLMNCQ